MFAYVADAAEYISLFIMNLSDFFFPFLKEEHSLISVTFLKEQTARMSNRKISS